MAVPQPTRYQGKAMQIATLPQNHRALVTGALAGTLVGSHDVDGGVTSIRSPLIDLTETANYTLTLSYYLAHLHNTSDNDFLRITAVSENGLRKVLLNETGTPANRVAQWQTLSKDLSMLAGSSIYLLIEAADGGAGSIVEAAVDAIRIEKTTRIRTGTDGLGSGNTGTRGDTLYSENFESTTTWKTNPYGTDSALAGQWETGSPEQTSFLGTIVQPATTLNGEQTLVTGKAAGNTVGAHDIDGGMTSAQSPLITLPAGHRFVLTMNYYFAHLWNTTAADYLQISAISADGRRNSLLRITGTPQNKAAIWQTMTVDLSAYSGQAIYLLVEAADAGSGSVIESAIDNIKITYQ